MTRVLSMKSFFKKLPVFIFLCVQASIAYSDSIDVLLCAYDMGDTVPLKSVIKQFDQQNISYRIVAIGKASEEFKDHSNRVRLDNLSEDELKTWPRPQPFNEENLTQLQKEYQPKLVMVGMASAAQAQLANAFKSKGSCAIAFYDNFDPITSKEYVQPFLENVEKIDAYLIPAQATLESFQQHPKTKASKLEVVGQPVLESWDDIFAKTDRAALRQTLEVSEKDKVVLFVGGYDDTYCEHFTHFVDGAKNFLGRTDIKFFVTYHPKTEGELEKNIIQEKGVNNIKVIEKTGAPSTTEIATLANVIVCHKSSVGMQALYKGIPVIYLVKKGDYTNFALDQGLAQQAESAQQFCGVLDQLLSTANQNRADVTKLGIPEKATQTIVNLVKAYLQQPVESLKKQA